MDSAEGCLKGCGPTVPLSFTVTVASIHQFLNPYRSKSRVEEERPGMLGADTAKLPCQAFRLAGFCFSCLALV